MENLGIDIKLIAAQIANFAIFFFVFYKFISKPFFQYLNRQKSDDEARESFANDLEARKNKLEEEDRKRMLEQKKLFEKALQEGKVQAEAIKKELIEKAKSEAENIIVKAKAQIQDEREMLHKDLRKQIAQVSMMVVEKSFSDYLTQDAAKAITRNIINHIPQDTKLEN